MQIIGTWLVFSLASDRAQAAVLSLVFPGGGFLYGGLTGLFAVTVALMALAVPSNRCRPGSAIHVAHS
jgi:hypothetical protein